MAPLRGLLVLLLIGTAISPAFAQTVNPLLEPPNKTATIVESHTSYVTITSNDSTPRAAIAALVQEVDGGASAASGGSGTSGGVLWFDDSFLHTPPEPVPVCGGGFWVLQNGTSPRIIDFAITKEDNPDSQDISQVENATPEVRVSPPQTDAEVRIDLPGRLFIPEPRVDTPSFIQPLEDHVVETVDALHGTSLTWTVVEYNADPANQAPQTRFWGVEVLTPENDTSAGDGCVVEDAVPGDDRLDFGYNALMILPFDEILGPSGTVEHDPENDTATEEGTKDGNSHPYNPDGCGDPAFHCHGDDPDHVHDTKRVDLEYRPDATPLPSGNEVFRSVSP